MNKSILKKDGAVLWLHFAVIVVAVCIAYSRVFRAGFMSWDDGDYILRNSDIKSFSPQNISRWFSSYYIGNYHPFTMASYAIDYVIGQKGPLIYHLTNIFLGICNACVLYRIVKRLAGGNVIPLFVALLFAIHPLQTESISWVAERKTVLAAFFYFFSLLQYISWARDKNKMSLVACILFGIAAMLSKGTAVVLPVSFFAVDIWMQGSLADKRLWLAKLPLLLCGLVLGLVAIKAQGEGKFLDVHGGVQWSEKIIFAGYAYTQYIVRILAPVHLSVIYPYPPAPGPVHYLFFVAALAIVISGIIAYKKTWYVLCGGILFYTVNIAVVLQLVQFGESLMADRYAYIALVGILFPIVYYPITWLRQKARLSAATIAFSAVSLALTFLTLNRNDIWLSDMNFFTAILDTFPNSAVAHYSIGGLYMRDGKYPEADEHMDKAVQLEPGNYKAWYNKGVLLLREQKPEEALDALNRCIVINEYGKALFSRALLYQATGRPALALADIEKVLQEQPQNARAYYIKADCLEHKGDVNGALDNYNSAIQYDGRDPLFFIRRGLAYAKTGRTQLAMADMDAAVNINPGSGEALYYRGMIKYKTGQNPCSDLQQALSHGYRQAQAALAQVCNH